MNDIEHVRQVSRQLIRELGLFDAGSQFHGLNAQHCHALVEIAQDETITISKLSSLLLLSVSATSRLVQQLIKKELIFSKKSSDKREKVLYLSQKGVNELQLIDSYSNQKVEGAFEFLTESEQKSIVEAITIYTKALEKSRRMRSEIKIATLSTSRTLRRQIVSFIESIQKGEFKIAVPDDVNISVLQAEKHFYYNSSSNFWYATNEVGEIIGTMGLKKIDEKNGEIKKVFVEKRYRGKGVSQKLMQQALKAATVHGFKVLWLGCIDAFISAHKFYEKCGFIRVDEAELPKRFEKCPVDTRFYSKTI